MLVDMVKYYEMLKKHNINIIYSGPIWMDGVECIGTTLRKRLEFDAMPLGASQAVFSVFIEQMNNMLHYSADREVFQDENSEKNQGTGVFILGCENRQYFLQTGNVMKKQQQKMMKERIDYLNTLDKKELRRYYKERIKAENNNPDSMGAGIGLIEIARRASSKIEYSFTELDEENLFFSMYVTIGNTNKEK